MVKHNNIIPNQHFHKKWDRRTKTWFHQPLQKKIRREKRKAKAAEVFPRPAQGALRPVVHCPTQKYNIKVKYGRGFSLDELKECKVSPKYAATIGIAVDHRRTNKSVDSVTANVERLKEYLSRLVVFPKNSGTKNLKKGDAGRSDRDVGQLAGEIIPKPAAGAALSFSEVTDDMTKFEAHSALRVARNEKKMKGKRDKAAADRKAAEDK